METVAVVFAPLLGSPSDDGRIPRRGWKLVRSPTLRPTFTGDDGRIPRRGWKLFPKFLVDEVFDVSDDGRIPRRGWKPPRTLHRRASNPVLSDDGRIPRRGWKPDASISLAIRSICDDGRIPRRGWKRNRGYLGITLIVGE